jgi:hypothetical protein
LVNLPIRPRKIVNDQRAFSFDPRKLLLQHAIVVTVPF